MVKSKNKLNWQNNFFISQNFMHILRNKSTAYSHLLKQLGAEFIQAPSTHSLVEIIGSKVIPPEQEYLTISPAM